MPQSFHDHGKALSITTTLLTEQSTTMVTLNKLHFNKIQFLYHKFIRFIFKRSGI